MPVATERDDDDLASRHTARQDELRERVIDLRDGVRALGNLVDEVSAQVETLAAQLEAPDAETASGRRHPESLAPPAPVAAEQSTGG